MNETIGNLNLKEFRARRHDADLTNPKYIVQGLPNFGECERGQMRGSTDFNVRVYRGGVERNEEYSDVFCMLWVPEDIGSEELRASLEMDFFNTLAREEVILFQELPIANTEIKIPKGGNVDRDQIRFVPHHDYFGEGVVQQLLELELR